MPNSYPRPWRTGSVFGTGPRRPLDRESRAVWRARLDLARRAGRITALHALVGSALARRLGIDGRCDPSHATIAADAGTSARTVRRALVALAACGMVQWVRRLVRDGWRTAQTSNAYALVVSSDPMTPAIPSGGQAGRQTLKEATLSFTAMLNNGNDTWGLLNRDRQLSLLTAKSVQFAQE